MEMRGIRRARVETDAFGITGIKVLIVPERDARQVVVDVRELAAELLGMAIEPARVQVLSSHGLEQQRRAGRRKLSSLATRRANGRFSSRVTLELDGDALVGEVEMPSGLPAQYHSVARAVLRAIDNLLEAPVTINAVEVLNVGDAKLALVSLRGNETLLVGAALVQADEYDAIARATLDALNRVVFEARTRERVANPT